MDNLLPQFAAVLGAVAVALTALAGILAALAKMVRYLSEINHELRKPDNLDTMRRIAKWGVIRTVVGAPRKGLLFFMSQSHGIRPSDTLGRKLKFWIVFSTHCLAAAIYVVSILSVTNSGIHWAFESYQRSQAVAALFMFGGCTLLMSLPCRYHVCQAVSVRSAILGMPLPGRFRLPFNGGV